MTDHSPALRLAVFASGRGSNFEAILRASRQEGYPCRPVCVLSDRRSAPVLKTAREAGLAARAFGPACWRKEEPRAKPVIEWLREERVEAIALAGFLRLLPAELLAAWPGKVLNVHPALLPAYGGPGMYGMRVHHAVYEAGEETSGATIHRVDEIYDHGEILAQASVDIRDCRNAQEVADRVLEIEHTLYPETLARFCRGELPQREKVAPS